jgi:hypothetical protein
MTREVVVVLVVAILGSISKQEEEVELLLNA